MIPLTKTPDWLSGNATSSARGVWGVVAVLLLISLAFIIDLQLPLGVAGGVLYVVPAGLTLWFLPASRTLQVAALCAILIVIGAVLSPPSHVPLHFVFINRAFALLAMAMIVAISRLRARLVADGKRLAALSALEERERLSRELHDDLSQSLGGIGALASAASQLLAQDRTAEAREELDQLRARTGHAFLDLRQFITGLRLRPWEDRQFFAALEDFTRQFALQAGISLNLDIQQHAGQIKLAPEAEVQSVRIIQECLNNIARHARAKMLSVTARASGNRVRIIFRDDGEGFDPALVNSPDHLGLEIMRERAEIAGGRLLVSSARGLGTSVTLELPCEKVD